MFLSSFVVVIVRTGAVHRQAEAVGAAAADVSDSVPTRAACVVCDVENAASVRSYVTSLSALVGGAFVVGGIVTSLLQSLVGDPRKRHDPR